MWFVYAYQCVLAWMFVSAYLSFSLLLTTSIQVPRKPGSLASQGDLSIHPWSGSRYNMQKGRRETYMWFGPTWKMWMTQYLVDFASEFFCVPTCITSIVAKYLAIIGMWDRHGLLDFTNPLCGCIWNHPHRHQESSKKNDIAIWRKTPSLERVHAWHRARQGSWSTWMSWHCGQEWRSSPHSSGVY